MCGRERAGEQAGGRKHTGTRTYVYGCEYTYTREHAYECLGLGLNFNAHTKKSTVKADAG